MKQLETSFVLYWMSLLPSNTSAYSSHMGGRAIRIAHKEPNSSSWHEFALRALFHKIKLEANPPTNSLNLTSNGGNNSLPPIAFWGCGRADIWRFASSPKKMGKLNFEIEFEISPTTEVWYREFIFLRARWAEHITTLVTSVAGEDQNDFRQQEAAVRNDYVYINSKKTLRALLRSIYPTIW